MAANKLREEITIYKGYLDCQFSDIEKNPLGHTIKNSKIKLEPRFKLYDAEIVSSFSINEISKETSFIHQCDNLFPIECHFKSEKEKSGRYIASEITLLLKNEGFIAEENSLVDFEKVINQNDTVAKKDVFLSSSIDNQHGRIKGDAYCKLVKFYDEKDNEVLPIVYPSGNVIISGIDVSDDFNNNKGCFFIFTSIFARFFKTIFDINTWIKSKINSFSSRVFNKNIIGNDKTNSGCMNSILPSGCTSSGCSQFGCGCLSLLLALAFLFWFIWCLILGKCQNEQQSSSSDTNIIHDTVYIEVNKTKFDTIIKKDTIIYEDKTTKTKISVVSLPNVQFEKNKAKLLDSSKEDLDKLAKHLIENKQVQAEIIGHTDNEGEAEANLKLSQARAESVRQYLIKAGVEAERIKAVGKGESEPKTTNETLEGRAMNRRVEVKLSQTEKVEETKKRVKTNQ